MGLRYKIYKIAHADMEWRFRPQKPLRYPSSEPLAHDELVLRELKRLTLISHSLELVK